jgi:hypothetical protein
MKLPTIDPNMAYADEIRIRQLTMAFHSLKEATSLDRVRFLIKQIQDACNKINQCCDVVMEEIENETHFLA